MLIYTDNLDRYIRKVLLPKLLLDPNNYQIKGSYRRRIKYITDIDVVNKVYPKINSSNIYQVLLKHLDQIESNPKIILVCITLGKDKRFEVTDGSAKEAKKILKLLEPSDAEDYRNTLKNYADDPEKKIFYLKAIVYKYYSLCWPVENVRSNVMIKQGKKFIFTDLLNENTSFIFDYYVWFGNCPIAFDVVINYEEEDFKEAYESAANYQLKLANYSKEYYYMLFPFRYYFRINGKKEISKQLEHIIENQFGLYKQLMVRIDSYRILYRYGFLSEGSSVRVIRCITKDVTKLPSFSTNIVQKIVDTTDLQPLSQRLKQWNTLLDVLYDQINANVNNLSKKYFFHYLDMLPESIRSEYYLE